MNVPGNISRIDNSSIGKIDDAGVIVPNGRVEAHWNNLRASKWSGQDYPENPKKYLTNSDYFIDRFNLKFVEFGNWMNQQDRADFLFNTAVSFNDLSLALKIEVDEIGLQKNLAIAFGARGRSAASGHFEQLNSAIINLTKTKGKYSVLAHEYGHAFDNLIGLAIFGDVRFVSGDTTRKNVDQEILANGNYFEKWFELFFQALYYKSDGSKTAFYNRMVSLDSDYWENRLEIWARYFEMYVGYRQRELAINNRFLSRDFKTYLKLKAYPSLEEFNAALPFAEKILTTGLKLLLNKSKKITSHGVVKELLPKHQQELLKTKRPGRNAAYRELPNEESFKGNLGAVEVLNQSKITDYNGYVPSYKNLDSYDHLIDPAANKTTHFKKGGLDETIEAINKVTANNYKQVSALASHLKADTLDQTYFNIWHFIKTNIKYDFDLPGIEEIRSPARTWADRLFRADCEDMAIFAGSILKNLNIPFAYTIVGFNGLDFYQHIYVTAEANNKEIVIDGVMAKYGVHPDNITKRMDIQVLSGDTTHSVNGLGGTNSYDSYSKSLIINRDGLRKKLASADSAAQKEAINKEIRKATYMIMLNGTPEREVMMHLMHVVDDVTEQGIITWSEKADLEKIALYMEKVQGILEAEELSGFFKNVGKKIGGAVKDVGGFIKTNVKSAGKDIKKIGGKLKDAFMKYNPATILIRNSFLGLMNLNFLKYAAKIGYGYVTQAEAKARGYNMEKWAKAVDRRKDVEDVFKKFGGESKNLKKAVKNGAKRNGVTFSGLGEPISIGTLITAATAILSIVAGKLKGVDPNEIDPNHPNESPSDKKARENEEKGFLDKGLDAIKNLPPQVKDIAVDLFNQKTGGGINPGGGSYNKPAIPGRFTNGGGGNSVDTNSGYPRWIAPVVITGVVAGGIILLKRSN